MGYPQRNWPDAQDFCDRAEFKVDGDQMKCRLDGEVYNVNPHGDDHVAIVHGEIVVAVLGSGFVSGKFVPQRGLEI